MLSNMTTERVDERYSPVSWLKGVRKDFEDFPQGLTGLGSEVMELALRDRGDAFRVVYALQMGDDIWVIHAFQKKSRSAIRTQTGYRCGPLDRKWIGDCHQSRLV
jgi:hypothetical protein